MSFPFLQRFALLAHIVMHVISALHLLASVIEYALGDFPVYAQFSQAGATGAAKVVSGEWRDSIILEPALTASDAPCDQLRIGCTRP